MSVKISFLGASGTVTGSKYLIQTAKHSIVVDGGMFQGAKKWRARNWDKLEFDPKAIDAVLLTHAHIDHTGFLPRFNKLGLRKTPIYATGGTIALLRVLLPDAGRIQEEDANFRRKHGNSSHNPPLPLYTEVDSQKVLEDLKLVEFDAWQEIVPGIKAVWVHAGHILGASSILLDIEGQKLLFSGDIGRYDDPIMKAPSVDWSRYFEGDGLDALLIESTYGNRTHPPRNLKDTVKESVARAEKEKGALIIPSFAVGRTQSILFCLDQLKASGEISDIPVIVDSPMARDATNIYKQFINELKDNVGTVLSNGGSPFTPGKTRFVRNRSESIALNKIEEPMIIISASGMLSGGRILHHLLHRLSSPKTTVMFVGYQPPGGKGHHLVKGGKSLRIFHQSIPVNAKIETVGGLSAHGDRDELQRWCQKLPAKPKKVFVVHGESKSAASFAEKLNGDFGWRCELPKYLEEKEV